MIAIGQLDTPITIQENVYSQQTNYGGVGIETWQLASVGEDSGPDFVWAFMYYRSGSEKEIGEQRTGIQKVEFYIRYETYKDYIQPVWRVRHRLLSGDYTYFYIESIEHIDGRHKMTKLITTMKDNNPKIS